MRMTLLVGVLMLASGCTPPTSPAGGAAYPAQAATPVVPAPPPSDGSWSLLEQQQWAAISRNFTKNLDSVNEGCGTRLAGDFVFESFRRHFAASADTPLDEPTRDHAVAPFDALVELCRGGGSGSGMEYADPEISKRAIRAKLQRIEVRWGGPAMGPSTVFVGGGVLQVTINPADGVSYHDYKMFVRKEVLKRL